MNLKKRRTLLKKTSILKLFTISILFICLFSGITFSESEKIEVAGKVYEFDKDDLYQYNENDAFEKTSIENTYGAFSISGIVSDVNEKFGVPSYKVANGNLKFFYNHGDSMLHSPEDSWHLVYDKSKRIADLPLESNIMKGTVVLQTSKDKKNWTDAKIIYNAFEDTPIRTDPIYSTTDIQLINGCFYRIIIAYELSRRTEDSNFLFINTDKYEHKKYVELYEFYAYTNTGEDKVTNPLQTYSLGTKVRVDNFDGYFGQELIDKKDIHYGWDLGNFFVDGYTSKVTNLEGNQVFLKNVGDKVTLWFKLNHDISALNGNSKLTVTADKEGYDQYFETPRMNFGRGTLIIRYTDYNNVKKEPTIYTNYLESSTSIDSDTKVQLFEEGDYEVALDYEVTSDELIDKIGHYRIFFKFSVRNGNCMVYPFDVKTKNELTNSSFTKNGFKLDLAKSRYLKINIKREILKESADGLIEDTRFNGPAKDGAEYTDGGIYTITVNNEYTNQFTVKKIYVGNNSILRAHIATGLSIPEINSLISQGATISDDGNIELSTMKPTSEKDEIESESTSDTPLNQKIDISKEKLITNVPIISSIISICAVILFIFSRKKRKKNTHAETKHGKNERGLK